jgi:hypothetical protein
MLTSLVDSTLVSGNRGIVLEQLSAESICSRTVYIHIARYLVFASCSNHTHIHNHVKRKIRLIESCTYNVFQKDLHRYGYAVIE